MLQNIIVLLLLGISAIGVNSNSNVLILYDIISPSHHIWNYAIAKGLLDKGHNVTMLGPYTDRQTGSSNYHPISIKEISSVDETEDLTQLSSFGILRWMFSSSYEICSKLYQTEGFKKLMEYSENVKFDAILYDITGYSCLYPLIEKFNFPPTIGITAFLLPPYLSDMFGNSLQPAYIPHFSLRYSTSMTFIERIWNYIFNTIDVLKRQTTDVYYMQKLARNVLGKEYDYPKIERHISLLLSNYDPVLSSPQPLTPNIIAVGGLHVKPAGPIHPILKQILDNAGRGFIYFALGTNVDPSTFPRSTLNAILEAFGRLNHTTIIWKVAGQLDQDLKMPSNVIIMKWLPQNDILGHPNLKLFISHGGALSVQEAAYHGVPILGIPFFMDQHYNLIMNVEKGAALKLDYDNITADNLYNTANEMLTNPRYTERAKMLSKLIKDQQNTPLDRAIYWIEYAMRHNGTEFLTPKSRDMPRFIISNSDVIAFFILIIIICSLGTMFLLNRLYCTTGQLRKKIKHN